MKIYLVPNFKGMTLQKFFTVFVDALGQLFFSISVAMGIMVAYGSYVKKETNLMNRSPDRNFRHHCCAARRFDDRSCRIYLYGDRGYVCRPWSDVCLPAEGLQSMGAAGGVIGTIFFLMVSFAAITSSVSVMESIVSCMIDKFHISRKKSTVIVTVYACLVGIIVCLGYNALYFELKLPNGATAQILDVMDFISNNLLMPLVALLSCILIGWVVKPQVIIDEVTLGGYKFGRKRLYIVMVKFIAPVLLAALLLQSFGILNV